MNDDVGGDASKSNSGLFSTSATMPVGTLECRLRTIAHGMIMHICQDLEVPVIECGSIAPILYPDQLATAKNLTERAFQNGVYDYEILPAQDILEMEPVLNPEILGGIYSPRDRQANQFIFVSAMAENAAENGVEFVLDCKVTGTDVSDGKIHKVYTTQGDFEPNWVINAAGLTASIGIAGYIVHGMKEAGLQLERKVGWKRTRKGIARFADKTIEEKDALIAIDPLYGKIICRCEQVTESEILQAIHRPVGAKTLDAVKRRVRAGMGRCQSGFCSPHVIEIIARELGIPEEEVRKRGEKAFMLSK